MTSPINMQNKNSALQHVAILVAVILLAVFYFDRQTDSVRRDLADRQARSEQEMKSYTEIHALERKLMLAGSKETEACYTAAGLHYGDESPKDELARLRRVEACVNQMAKPATP